MNSKRSIGRLFRWFRRRSVSRLEGAPRQRAGRITRTVETVEFQERTLFVGGGIGDAHPPACEVCPVCGSPLFQRDSEADRPRLPG